MQVNELLSQAELFRGVSAEELSALIALGKEVQVKSGDMLFRLGDDAERIYVVTRGRIVLALPIEVLGTQQEAYVEELGPKELVGWSAITQAHKYTASARASLDCELWGWNGTELNAYLRTHSDLGVRILQNVTSLIYRRLSGVQAMWIRELQRTVASRIG